MISGSAWLSLNRGQMKGAGLNHSRGKQRPADNSAVRAGGEIARALDKNRKERELNTDLAASPEQGDGSFDLMSVGFVTFTADGLIQEINPSAVQLLRHHGHGVIGTRFVEFVASADRGKFLEHLARCRQNTEPTHPSFVELQLAGQANEEPVFIELFSIPISENQAGQTVYKSVFRNITSLKQMQEVHRWLAAIVEHSDDAILGLDLHGKIISCNKGALQLYGYLPEELIGQPITILTPVELQNKEQMILQRVRRGEVIEHYETVRQHKEGRHIDVSLSISPIKDAQGKIIGASKTARDVTERKRAERELADILAREQAANRAKDDFLAALSHELRTPLSPVLLLASDAAHDPDVPPHIRKNFDTIRKNIELEARLIDDLLDLTRITRGKLVLNQSILDVHEILNDAILTVLNEIEQKQIVLKLDLRAQGHKIFGDAVRLQQIFWNVLKNAVKFSYEGQITVASQTLPGDKILINITDTGIGMSPDEIDHIFGAFSQGKHHFGGLGLGLAISRALVELHSGLIRASSPGKGKGSTFSIELPLVKSSEKKETISVQPAPKRIAITGETPAQRLHILLVEDHEPTRLALTQLLLHRRYKVTTAGSLAKARSLMEKHDDFHLLISDIGLPDGSGYDLMSEFQKKFAAGGIALTGYGREQDVARSEASGFTAHLTKPVRIELLEKALAVAVNKARAP